MLILLFVILGLIAGSFLNAVAHRLFTGEDFVAARSHCVHCQQTLAARDLIPIVSFLFLRGRCRYCDKPISWQYPMVEITTAIVFVLIAQSFAFQLSSVGLYASLVFALFLVLIALFDLKHYLILDKVVLPAIILAILYQLYLGIATNNIFGLGAPIAQGLIGSVIIAGFFYLQYKLSYGRWIGFGDVKLGIFLGLIFGLGQSIMLLLIAYCLGALIGVLLILSSRKNLSSKLPFGTILGISAIIMLVWGQSILTWYQNLIGFN